MPKDPAENIRFRQRLNRLALGDKEVQAAIWSACQQDILYYVNTFCFTYDPRKTLSILPWITFPCQDEAFVRLVDAIRNQYDLLVNKSRDMGASWMMLTAFEWFWHFHANKSFLLGSRKEDYVDKSGDPKSLMWKIDFLLKHQPKWLRPKFTRLKLHLHNHDNESSIDGESTNADFATGDRRTAIGLDEFALVENGFQVDGGTQHATGCRIINSTTRGMHTAYYAIKQKMPAEQKVRLAWWEWPEKALGLYTAEDGNLRRLSDTWPGKPFPSPDDYPWILDGKTRSPWYDRECRRAASDQQIAQELDMDDGASDFLFFDPVKLENRRQDSSMPPLAEIGLIVDRLTCEAEFDFDCTLGQLKLWMNLTADGSVPQDREFIVGGDISQGTGASSSTLSIADRRTQEKVGEYAINTTEPKEFARLAVAVCRLFNDAFLIWEANGGGLAFGRQVLASGYRHIYYRHNETDVRRKPTTKPGFFSTPETKSLLLQEFRSALLGGDFVVRSEKTYRECREFVHRGNGQIVHSQAANTINLSDKDENHGDMVIADAVTWLAMKQFRAVVREIPKEIPYNCGYARRQRAIRRWKEAELA